MIHYIQRGDTAQLTWALYGLDKAAFSLEGLAYRLYYITGRGRTRATGVTHQDNILAWTFLPDAQWASGSYSLALELYDSTGKFVGVTYPDAFYIGRDLPSEDAHEGSIVDTPDTTNTINIKSVHDLYKLSPVIPVVGSNGYWYVNGVLVVDGSGEPVPAHHTLTFDPLTKYLIIDAGRVDKEGESIAVTITDIADALEAQRIAYMQAETQRDATFSASQTAREQDYASAETKRDSAYQQAEAARDTAFGIAEAARQSAESARASAEANRQSAEGVRAAAEMERRSSETVRQTAETQREATMAAFEGKLVRISDVDFAALEEAGQVDPAKIYFVYEAEEEEG